MTFSSQSTSNAVELEYRFGNDDRSYHKCVANREKIFETVRRTPAYEKSGIR